MGILLAITLLCCSDVTGDSSEFRKLAAEKLGSSYSIIFNSDSTFLIAYRTSTDSKKDNQKHSIYPPLKFFIYNIKSSESVFEDNLPNGQASWLNKSQVKIQTIPGIVKFGEEKANTGYVYDINSKKKILKNQEVHQQ